ncbi:hypothetical protein AT1G33355 [Arabidopsis thaliana]|nr:uncharacterized protein AT1G33355 [Arabidopsis thaliana]ANM61057.1 hypothetical protein AT1G33355 [Arabidopsis thaliana]|eukprot:NP_001336515.1 hypothetical protein AT1G33355 [Arabidopsis thaliana]
MRKVLEN